MGWLQILFPPALAQNWRGPEQGLSRTGRRPKRFSANGSPPVLDACLQGPAQIRSKSRGVHYLISYSVMDTRLCVSWGANLPIGQDDQNPVCWR